MPPKRLPKYVDFDEMGKKYGKYDLDRVGLFSEMPYLIGDKFNPTDITSGTRDLKKSQMYPSILKTKTGLQDAYFDTQYKRLFENEKRDTPKRPTKSDKPTKPFIPSDNTKRHSTPGDSFGTFGPNYPAMSNVKKPSPKQEKIPANILTIPTNTRGPGWTDRGMSPFPKYISSPYGGTKKIKNDTNNSKKSLPFLTVGGPGDFFEKNPYLNDSMKPTYNFSFKEKFKGAPFLPPSSIKNVGNGFDPWPSHMVDLYKSGGKKDEDDKNISKSKFYPQGRNKSFYTVSTMQRKLRCAQNNTNWRTFEPITFRINQ